MNKIKIVVIIGLLSGQFACGPAGLDSDYELKDLTYEQRAEFKTNLEMSKLFLEEYGEDGTSEPFDSKNLDQAFQNWLSDESENKESAETVIEYLGVAFGQDLINTMNCEWKVLSDSYGEDFTAIHTKYEITTFPFSSVYKMIEERDPGRTFEAIKEFVGETIREAEESGEMQERRDK